MQEVPQTSVEAEVITREIQCEELFSPPRRIPISPSRKPFNSTGSDGESFATQLYDAVTRNTPEALDKLPPSTREALLTSVEGRIRKSHRRAASATDQELSTRMHERESSLPPKSGHRRGSAQSNTPLVPGERVLVDMELYEVCRDLFKNFIIYILEVTFRPAVGPEVGWMILRRYREFYELNLQLLQLFPSVVAQIGFPRKQWFFNTRPSFVEKRRLALQQYIKDLVSHPDIVQSQPLRDFLELPSNFVPLVTASPRVSVRSSAQSDSPPSEMQKMESAPPPRRLLNLKDDLNILYRRLSLYQETGVQLCDFQICKRIGRGGYSEVYLCQKIDSKQVLALKRMTKDTLSEKNQTLVTRLKIERDILVLCSNSQWMVPLHYSFQDNTALYLVMEYMPGGDMRNLLNNCYLPEEAVKFYLAQMFMAVHTLHRLGYIHRDLKPENFLIDRLGHIKLTDFGLSIDVPKRLQLKRTNSGGEISHHQQPSAETPLSKPIKAYTPLVAMPPTPPLSQSSRLFSADTSTDTAEFTDTDVDSPVAPFKRPTSVAVPSPIPTQRLLDRSPHSVFSQHSDIFARSMPEPSPLHPSVLATRGSDSVMRGNTSPRSNASRLSPAPRPPRTVSQSPNPPRSRTSSHGSPDIEQKRVKPENEAVAALRRSSHDGSDSDASSEGAESNDELNMTGDGDATSKLWVAAPVLCVRHQDEDVFQDVEEAKGGGVFSMSIPQVTRTPRSLSNPPRTNYRVYSCVGSPCYTAVEIVKGQGYGAEVDWWSLGVILYEMLLRCTPFDGESADEVLSSILRYPELLHYPGPEVMSPIAWDLVSRLVCGPENRLGFEGVQRHPFFNGIDWDSLHEMTPPFIPQLEDEFDTSYFDNVER